MTSAIPLPTDPRHQRFADLVLRGESQVEAYQRAGYKAKGAAASVGASRLMDRADVVEYMDAIKLQAAEGAVMDVREKREFLARIKRTAITDIDYETGKNTDLIKTVRINESETGSSMHLEKLDPLAAIKIDNDLAGEGNPQKDAISQLALAIASLGSNSPLPEDEM